MFRHFFQLLILLSVLLLTCSQGLANGNKLALYHVIVESKSFSSMDQRINSSLCNKLNKYEKFEVLSQNDCDKLLEDPSNSLLKAQNLNSATKIAKEIDLNYLITGKIYDANDVIILEMVLVDVNNGKEIKKVSREVSSSFSRLISVDFKNSLDELLL